MAGDVTFQAPDTHQTQERLPFVPVLDLLAVEVGPKEVDFLPDVVLAEGDIKIWRPEIAVILGNFEFEDQMVAECVPGQLTGKAVIWCRSPRQ